MSRGCQDLYLFLSQHLYGGIIFLKFQFKSVWSLRLFSVHLSMQNSFFQMFTYFFKGFFNVGIILKVFIEFVTVLLLFYVFGPEACGILDQGSNPYLLH